MAERAFPLRSLWLRQSLRSPWTWLAWILLAAVPLEEIVNAGAPGRSGLVALPTAAIDWPSLAWICAVTTLLGAPVLFLAYEATAQRIKEPGFLQILMVSAGGEPAFRQAETRALAPLAFLLALPALVLPPFAAAGQSPQPGATYVAALAALATFLIPNIFLVLALALRWSNRPSRLLPLLGLALYPLAAAAAFRLILAGLGDSGAALALAALEPTGTALFAALFNGGPGSQPLALSGLAWLLIAANRLLVVLLGLALLRFYRRGASFLEVRAGLARLRLPARLGSHGVPLAAGLVGALLALSNLQSNFGKNLLFYEVDPTMSFLFDRAIGGLEASLLVLLPLLLIHAAWRDSESGFQVFRDMSARGERRRVLGFLGSALASCAIFYLVLLIAIHFAFAARPGDFDGWAIALHFGVNSLPTVLLVAFAAAALSLLGRNRVSGIALAGAVGAALLFAALSRPALFGFATPLLPRPPRYSEALGGLLDPASFASHALLCFAIVAAASAWLVTAWPRPHRWSGFRRLRGDRRAAAVFLAAGAGFASAGVAAWPESPAGGAAVTDDIDLRAGYERAAASAPAAGDWQVDRAVVRARWTGEQDVRLAGTLHLRGRGRLLLTWAADPAAGAALWRNGARVRPRRLAAALYDLGTPPAGEATLAFTVHLTSAPARLTTLFGEVPTVPLPGILPELFLGGDAERAERGLGDLRAAMAPFSRGASASRPMARVALTQDYPCDRTLAAPFGAAPRRLDSRWCRISAGPVAARLELFAALGPHLRASSVPSALPLITLTPARFADRQRRLDAATDAASRDIAALMGGFPVPGLTVAAAEAGEIDGSALSKPGLIRVSSAYFLARRAGQPDPMYGTMAHELMHQYYGHDVRPVAGRPGAIFVNEFPAQLARSWAIRRRFGLEAYRAELSEAGRRRFYIRHFQQAPEAPPVRTTGVEEIYPRSILIVHFLAAHSGWPAQARAIRDFARRHAGGTVTAEQLAEAVLAPLAPRAQALGRAMLFDGLLVRRSADGRGIALDCGAAPCPSADVEVPVRVASGSVRWAGARDYRLVMGPLVGIPLG